MKISSLYVKNESRIALIPSVVKKMVLLGCDILLEDQYGSHLYKKEDFEKSGATFCSREKCLEADCVIQLFCEDSLINDIPSGKMLIGLTKPFENFSFLEKLADKNITTLSMEFVPRSTRAQKMDVLSSQASLAGYVAVSKATAKLNQVLPMMMTPAGTLSPARVFVVGAGVAGLQAIATAKRLGANVTAFDTRPVAEEQVKSLGASFLKIDLGDTGQTSQGYAKQLTEEQISKQRDAMKKTCAQSDIVITTAQLFGKKAPIIITSDMINAMKSGSVIVDCAASTGGNVEGVVADKEVQINGVHILGQTELAGNVAKHASEMYSANVFYLIEEFFDKESKSFQLNQDDEIIQSMLTTYQGQVVQPMLVRQREKVGG